MGWEWHNRKRTRKGTWAEQGKTEQLHIRCTLREKELLRATANSAQMDVSEYVLRLVEEDGRKRSKRAYTRSGIFQLR